MAFHNVTFPRTYHYGTTKTFSIAVEQFAADSGDAQATPLSRALFRFGLKFEKIRYDDAAALRRFYMCRMGKLHTFRFRDVLDCTTAPDGIGEPLGTDQPIVLVGTKYYLAKRYGATDRIIRLPVAESLTFTDAGAYVTASANATTGEVTGHAPSGSFRWGGVFDIPCRFDGEFNASYVDQGKDGFVNVEVPLAEILEELT